jgi:hypothetical protein
VQIHRDQDLFPFVFGAEPAYAPGVDCRLAFVNPVQAKPGKGFYTDKVGSVEGTASVGKNRSASLQTK